MKHSQKRFRTILFTAVLVIGIAASFWQFIADNSQRIARQNEEYLNEFTSQRAISVDRLISENLTFINSIAYLYGRSLTSPWADVAVIREFEENTVFTFLRFIDSSGDDYTSRGVMANLSDRDYFQAGMRGESGVTYVLNSRVTGEKQIGFYAPVRFGGDIVGVMVGFYGQEYIHELLEYELFGFEGEGWLCTQDGTVLGSTVEGEYNTYFDYLQAMGVDDGESISALRTAFVDDQNVDFTFPEAGENAAGYLVSLTQADWVLIRTFPPSASNQILRNANGEGITLILRLVVLFGLYCMALVVENIVEQRRMREANQNANDVSTGVSRLFHNFVAIDLNTGEYHYIGGEPSDPMLPKSGEYEAFCASLMRRMDNDAQCRETMRFISIPNLRELLADTDRVSLRVHTAHADTEWFTFNFIVLERDRQQPVRALLVSQDVTTLHRKEEEEQKRLQQALDLAESASRAKTEFLFNMSQDIRTPMNAIMGFTGIASTHIDDRERVRDSLTKIEASGKHLLSLINDILDMSKIESGKLQLNIEPFNVHDTVNHLMDMVQSQAKAKEQRIAVDAQIEHAAIQGDPLRLNQVLLNILSNAVKYTPNGGEIRFSIRELPAEETGGAIYEYTIADNGIGMSEEYLPHIFDHFTRERTSTVSKIQGTGLGMAIANNLVKLMGGTISVQSALGEGSTFTVRIPAQFAEEKQETGEGDSEVFTPERLAGLRLLLAEDNAINAEIAKVILNEAGFAVDWAENGQRALDMVLEGHERYHAILMDIQMPVMDGYASAAAIRAFEREQGLGRVPIIAMTANTFEDDRRNAFEAGMDAHIAKPYVPEEMIHTVAIYALYGVEEASKHMKG